MMGYVVADKEMASDRMRDGVTRAHAPGSDPADAVEPYEPKENFAFLEGSALALVAGAAQQLALLVLAHLLAALLDDAAHGPSERIDGSRGQVLAVGREVNCRRRRTGYAFT